MSLATKIEMQAFLSKNDVLSIIVCPIGHFPHECDYFVCVADFHGMRLLLEIPIYVRLPVHQ